jgi:hypothetical protein
MNVLRYSFALVLTCIVASVGMAERLPKNTVCDKICVPTVTPGKQTKTCYEVDYKEICVPGFRLPWSKSCEPVCGHVVRVKVLKQREYECPKCDVRWNLEQAPCAYGCQPSCQHGAASISPGPVAPHPTMLPAARTR